MTGEDEGAREEERSDRRDDESSPSLGYYDRHANERQRYTNKQTGRQTGDGQTDSGGRKGILLQPERAGLTLREARRRYRYKEEAASQWPGCVW